MILNLVNPFTLKNYLLIRDRDNICISKLLSKQNIKITDSCRLINYPIKMSLELESIFNFNNKKTKNSAILSYNKLKFPLTLRNWEIGDWFISIWNERKKS